MMSVLILSCRTGTPSRIIDEVSIYPTLKMSTEHLLQIYGPQAVNIPKMPSLGLLLEHPIFGSYNDRVSKINENLQPTDPEYRPPIDFNIHRDTIKNFKQEHKYNNMRVIEDHSGM